MNDISQQTTRQYNLNIRTSYGKHNTRWDKIKDMRSGKAARKQIRNIKENN